MSDLADAIKGRGYWQTLVRPRDFNLSRVSDLPAVPQLVSSLSINRRGWDFPHIDRRSEPTIGNDWVGQDTTWKYFKELWRVSRSGQLAHLGGFRYDWGQKHYLSPFEEVVTGELMLGMGDSLHKMSEVFEFAQRWAQAISPEGIQLSIEIGGLLNRRLVVDDPSRGATSIRYVARTPEPWVYRGDVSSTADLEALWACARTATTIFFQRFGFQANAEVLEDWQRKIGQ